MQLVINASWGLGAVDRRSTTGQVLHEIRSAILAGRIKPSERLPEVVLARAFGTGRSAIREALRQLVQEGLVISEHNHGVHVRPVEPEDAIDLYMARTAIEVAAVQQAIEGQAQLELDQLRAAQQRIEQVASADQAAPPSAALIAANLDFHRALVALAGSSRLSRAYEPLAAESQMLLLWHPTYPGPDYAANHRIVLTAIEMRDPNVTQMVRNHLELTSKL